MRTNIPHAEKKNGDNNDDPDLEEMTVCSICERDIHRLNHDINTCQECQQWIQRSTQKNDDYEAKHEKERMAKSQIDDETEFDRIPIAGENKSDYEDSDEYEEEENSILPYLEGEANEDTNSTDTEVSELQNVPIVIALSGPAQENNERKNEQKDTDTDDDSISTTIATIFNAGTASSQQNKTVFTTPTQKQLNEFLQETTTKNLHPLPSFDASIAYLEYPFPKESDAFAFLLEKEKMALSNLINCPRSLYTTIHINHST